MLTGYIHEAHRSIYMPVYWRSQKCECYDVRRSYEAGQNKKLKNKGTTKVGGGGTAKKDQDRMLRWYGHVKRIEQHYIGRKAMELKVQGRRKRGRPRRRWLVRVRDVNINVKYTFVVHFNIVISKSRHCRRGSVRPCYMEA